MRFGNIEGKKMKVKDDERGYYGNFGGAYIPEMLYPNVEELRDNYERIMAAPDFQEQFQNLALNILAKFANLVNALSFFVD